MLISGFHEDDFLFELKAFTSITAGSTTGNFGTFYLNLPGNSFDIRIALW